MKKLDKIINCIMGTFMGVFIGHGLYVAWNYKTYPEVYAMQSAPWYTSILVYGLFTIIILVIGILVKFILKYYEKKSNKNV